MLLHCIFVDNLVFKALISVEQGTVIVLIKGFRNVKTAVTARVKNALMSFISMETSSNASICSGVGRL